MNAVKTVAAYGLERQVVNEFDKIQQPPDSKTYNRTLLFGAIGFGLGQSTIPALCSLIFWYGGRKLSRDQTDVTALYSTFESAAIAAYAASKMFSYVGDVARARSAWSTFSKSVVTSALLILITCSNLTLRTQMD